ncbi:MAG: hypothetical protein KAH68_07320 [Draconibacterium sp.]|nr:hypothetical protein [Draconibacterium sp.]
MSSDAHLDNIYSALESESVLLTSAIRRLKDESVLEEKDEVRAVYYLTLGFMHHPNPAVKAAASEVEKVFDNYGLSITGESYSTESSLVNSLLVDLANPKLQAAIAMLSGLAEIIAGLQAAQTDFEETRIAYEEEKAKEGTLENATAIKKEVGHIINDKLGVYLHAMFQVDETAYGIFARTIAEIIADNNEVVKKRRKKPAAGE